MWSVSFVISKYYLVLGYFSCCIISYVYILVRNIVTYKFYDIPVLYTGSPIISGSISIH
jgi:hypothetical protein